MLISPLSSLTKETSSLPTLEVLVLTEAVDVEGTEIADDETAEEAHVVAAETDRIAFLHPAHFQVVFELFGNLFKPKQLK